ncbi:MAG: OmpH family outer membrane protein [Deltaproteobacteria bacterium]|nr:OmpH family outer membrane protein [Deltaproteobacteria bacterium]
MRKVMSFLVVASFILMGICAAEAGEIAFINMKKVVLESDAGKAAGLDLQKFMEGKKAQRQEKESRLQKMQADLKKQAPVLTESAYKEKELTYQKNYRDYKRFIEDANAEMKLKDQEFSRKLIPEILKVTESIGKKGGYACIMDVVSGKLVYYSKKNDITTKVIAAYNKVYNSKQ